MKLPFRFALALVLAPLPLAPARALCICRGVDYVRTTLDQEFRDSRWMCAWVVSGDSHWSDEDESWTLYRLEVVTSYKGGLRGRFALFTERNSGGFSMGREGSGVPDIGGDYLLFLVPDPRRASNPQARAMLSG